MGTLRKRLSAPGLLGTVRQAFGSIVDRRIDTATVPLVDALMSGLAVFSLKYPSLLPFDRQRHKPAEVHNLRTLYGVEQVSSDTPRREIIDAVH